MKAIVYSLVIILTSSAYGGDLKKATFAGGCFWCMEPPFEKLSGVTSVISGFSGGKKASPTYQEVASGETEHIESVQVSYDPTIISYRKLLETFWKNIDPTDPDGQFVDQGHQYSTAIFFHDSHQEREALRSKELLSKGKFFKKKIATDVRKFNTFYAAEEYHQDFYKKNLITKAKYKYYRYASGRDQFIEKYWKNSSFSLLESKYYKNTIVIKSLTPLQREVTQDNGTERPFKNEYWNNKREGIYVDIVSGEPLFSSKDKFKSGTGWPSFTRPLVSRNILEKKDESLFSTRIEVRSKNADSHLGHVFNDGPKPSGLRYCINSASLRFIPKENLEKEGYKDFIGK